MPKQKNLSVAILSQAPALLAQNIKLDKSILSNQIPCKNYQKYTFKNKPQTNKHKFTYRSSAKFVSAGQKVSK